MEQKHAYGLGKEITSSTGSFYRVFKNKKERIKR
jgi:hypothetical protein